MSFAKFGLVVLPFEDRWLFLSELAESAGHHSVTIWHYIYTMVLYLLVDLSVIDDFCRNKCVEFGSVLILQQTH